MTKSFLASLVVLGIAFLAGSASAATINGTVRGPNGQVLSDVEVKLFVAHHRGAAAAAPATEPAAQPGKKHHKGPAALQTATTDSSGHFSFTDLEAGEYQVVAGGKGVGRGHVRLGLSANATGTANISLAAPHPRKNASQ